MTWATWEAPEVADYEMRQTVVWIFTALLVILFVLSVMGDGTWMSGIAMGWMMAVPALLFAGALYFAYRYGRMLERAEHAEPQPKK